MPALYIVCGVLLAACSIGMLGSFISSYFSGRARIEPGAVKFRTIMGFIFFSAMGSIFLGEGFHWQWATSTVHTTVFFILFVPYFLSLRLANRVERRMKEKAETT